MGDSDVQRYDILGAYEVLEHAEDDASTIRDWARLLKDNGLMILSVPAHMKYWSFADEASGHYRRYEKENLYSLLEENGLQVLQIKSMGFPFLVMLMPLAHMIRHKPLQKKNGRASMTTRTKDTGLIASKLYTLRHLIPFRTLAILAKTQRLFYSTDCAYSYVVVAKKK